MCIRDRSGRAPDARRGRPGGARGRRRARARGAAGPRRAARAPAGGDRAPRLRGTRSPRGREDDGHRARGGAQALFARAREARKEAEGRAAMNELERVTPEEARARDAVRSLPRPVAKAAFRARLRQEFTTGTIESAAPAVVLALPWHRRATTRWGATAFAAAAA